ncbi:hypothetical protein PGTUg99_007209 [Puccinia graminis f. sp. tritici]|uniref:Uncharacterized protein n=1 Tax=Puccinia graminis f. sp. tritici TaxID=56615 RepID=A0A5B0RBY7_PUCGR|nr:hypothetical protein PGTUg99_007209 [Puccinia graminis f. sp. tritici]
MSFYWKIDALILLGFSSILVRCWLGISAMRPEWPLLYRPGLSRNRVMLWLPRISRAHSKTSLGDICLCAKKLDSEICCKAQWGSIDRGCSLRCYYHIYLINEGVAESRLMQRYGDASAMTSLGLSDLGHGHGSIIYTKMQTGAK